MRKVKLIVSTLCLVLALAVAMPTAVYASDGPQGGGRSTRDAPPPPSSSTVVGGVLGIVIAFLLS